MNQVILSDMTVSKVRILGIAPYDGMKSIMEQLCASRSDIDLDVYVGDLEQGVDIALKSIQSNYDILISRGGTAKMLEQESSLPVIEVETSMYDILRAIKLAENYSAQFAIVAYSNITANAHILCQLMQYDIDIFTINHPSDVEPTLASVRKKGYSLVLCDMITYTTARAFSMNAILITSGPESVQAALDQAVKLYKTCDRMMAEGHFYQEILRDSNQQVLVMRENGEVIFSTLSAELQPQALELLRPEIPSVIQKKTVKFFKNIEEMLYSCICRSVSLNDYRFAVFYLTINSLPIIAGKYGIQYSTRYELGDVFFNNIYNITSLDIDKLSEVSFPVLLAGEPGTGKEQAARMIYSRSRMKTNPLITISCALLNERSWNFLINHYNSPFNDNDNTIFLKSINSLSEDHFSQLLSAMIDTNLCKRNRVIFSCDLRAETPMPPAITRMVNLLSCVTYYLEPARAHTEDIPSLCTLYLNSLNLTMATQIIGLEADALRLLQEYDWPYNYTQFQRVINELALITSTPYIRTADVKKLLDKEHEISMPEKQASPDEGRGNAHLLDLNRPLSEINHEIIRLVLLANGGNQSAAAKQLGIGRSTLWRYLK